MANVVQVKQVQAQPIAVVRRQAKAAELSRVVPDCCGEVWNFIRSSGITGAGRHIALYLDCVMNIEVGVEVAGPFVSDGNVIYSETPAGTVAEATHFGPYNRLGDAHDAIHQWCSANHRELAGPSWEIYGHGTDDPAQIRTDVRYLLKTL